MTLKDWMMLYGVTLSDRRTKRQRYLFACQIKEMAEKMQLSFKIEEHKMGRYRVENIVLSNPETAKVVLAVGYDTPSKSLLPCHYYPFHQQLTLKEEKWDFMLKAFLIITSVILAVVTYHFAKGNWWGLCLSCFIWRIWHFCGFKSIKSV